jgi:hypothetical protein
MLTPAHEVPCHIVKPYPRRETLLPRYDDVLVPSLNVKLEIKAEMDNAEVRIDQVLDYQAIVNVEWEII